MTKTILTCVTIGSLLGGCVSSEIVWTKRAGQFTAQEALMDLDQCEARARGNPATAPMRTGFNYNNCMRNKGWYQIEIQTGKHDIHL